MSKYHHQIRHMEKLKTETIIQDADCWKILMEDVYKNANV